MTKKEISEIRRTISPKRDCVKKICGYYVTTDQQCIPIPIPCMSKMPEDATIYFLDTFKKVLSGTIGKTLNTVSFDNNIQATKNTQERMIRIRDSKLDDTDATQALCNSILANYDKSSPYCILVMHACYDVPCKNVNEENEGDSDTVFNYIIGCICPIADTKSFLSYNKLDNKLDGCFPIQKVLAPKFGFLFPAFNDRTSDINAVLAYNKITDTSWYNMFSSVLGCAAPWSEADEAEIFSEMTDLAFEGNRNFNETINIQSSLYDICIANEESGKSDDDATVTKEDLMVVLEDNYAPDIDSFAEKYDETVGVDRSLHIHNLVNPKKTKISMGEIALQIPTEDLHLLSVRTIDGMKCLVIKQNAETINVNDITVKN